MGDYWICPGKELMIHQGQGGLTKFREDGMCTEDMKHLIKHVKYCVEDVTRSTFRERLDGAFQSYKLVDDVNKIENFYVE